MQACTPHATVSASIFGRFDFRTRYAARRCGLSSTPATCWSIALDAYASAVRDSSSSTYDKWDEVLVQLASALRTLECEPPRCLCLMGEPALRRERWPCVYLAGAAAVGVQTSAARIGIGVAALLSRCSTMRMALARCLLGMMGTLRIGARLCRSPFHHHQDGLRAASRCARPSRRDSGGRLPPRVLNPHLDVSDVPYGEPQCDSGRLGSVDPTRARAAGCVWGTLKSFDRRA